ncbi:MAG: hypothetical protein UY05_C0025G0004 [Candidatus Peregrinibacteria bacterium GW2011_GWA2_47_7]|nr:MAG: hypothetical protein UY05_C0025G0004 [Candidatus Peregrinibacteria bacterium GW2011_GWA2_47_7]
MRILRYDNCHFLKKPMRNRLAALALSCTAACAGPAATHIPNSTVATTTDVENTCISMQENISAILSSGRYCEQVLLLSSYRETMDIVCDPPTPTVRRLDKVSRSLMDNCTDVDGRNTLERLAAEEQERVCTAVIAEARNKLLAATVTCDSKILGNLPQEVGHRCFDAFLGGDIRIATELSRFDADVQKVQKECLARNR